MLTAGFGNIMSFQVVCVLSLPPVFKGLMEGLPSAIALQACARIVGTLRQAGDSTLTSCGFGSVQQTAAEALTDLLADYIVEVGWRAAAVSSHASRTECSLPDVLQAIAAIGAAPHP